MTTKDNLTKAAQTADLLHQELREVYKDARGALSMVVWDAMNEVATIRQRLNVLAKEEGGAE